MDDEVHEVEVFLATASEGHSEQKPQLNVCINTGAPRSDVGGKALKDFVGKNKHIKFTACSPVKFGFGASLLTVDHIAKVRLPMGDDRFYFYGYDSYVVNEKALLKPLSYLLRLDALQNAYVDLENSSVRFQYGSVLPFETNGAHLEASCEVEPFYTQTEVERVHRRLDHLPAPRRLTMLQRAEPMSNKDQRALAKELRQARKGCKVCEEEAGKPLRSSDRSHCPDKISFHHTVPMNVFYLNNKPVLQSVCVDTGYRRATFSKDKSNKSVWDAFVSTWFCTTSGLSRELRVDQGSEFIVMGFTSTAQSHGISVVPISVEALWQLGLGSKCMDFSDAYIIV
ncbi:hypothetical protein FVE85_0169 [Porphyridium purpureum]|uniref:Integrase catalytic domain-containing protein n=1 Tax=Porphyridium purpureum TaxID=35688 RepID=A0A5J4YZL6_PORPP|nr:hypothetical protein FVE85_0169 [Porphyridium purpureum]|eukprot:POR4107..scf208_2